MTSPATGPAVPLKVVLIEDDPLDAELLVQELKKTGHAAQVHHVDTLEEFVASLNQEIDVVISDHALPSFNSLGALRIIQESGRDIPFIIVSGAISEEAAVEAMRAGATDYLIKDRLARLGESINNALRQRDVRREKELALARIRKSEALNRSILASLSAHIAVIDHDGCIISTNDAWEAFRAAGLHEQVGRPALGCNYIDACRSAIAAGDAYAAEMLAGLEGVLALRLDDFTMEYPLTGKEAPCWFEVRIRPLVSTELSGAVIAHTDITDRKLYEVKLVEAKQAAEEATEMKSTFLANMSHEIRTPLTAILGFSEILKDEVGPEHEETLSVIIEGGQRLKNTLTSVLELSQLKGGNFELSRAPIDVVALIEKTAALLGVQVAEKGIVFDTSGVERPLWIYSDAVALERIVSNLVSNAIKFTKRGRVAVAARRTGAWVEITVSDTGIGIDARYLSKLFDAFRQESSGLSRSYEGVGLGLAISKQLVELLGGTIGVESRKGAGSTFTVRLPIGLPEARETKKGPTAPMATVPCRVLVVEDNAMTRMLMARLLKLAHEPTLVATPEAALAVDGPFDVVLLDINLGAGMSGENLLPLLRSREAFRDASFIAMTAYALPGDRERFLEAGFDDYLPKPFSPDAVFEIIATASGKHR